MSLNSKILYKETLLNDKVSNIFSSLIDSSNTEEEKGMLTYISTLTFDEIYKLYNSILYDERYPLLNESFNFNKKNVNNLNKLLQILQESITDEISLFNDFEISKKNSLYLLRKKVLKNISLLSLKDNNYKYNYINSFDTEDSKNTIRNNSLLFPIIKKEYVNFTKLSIGQNSKGSLGSIDPIYLNVNNLDNLLNDKSIQWEQTYNDVCYFELEITVKSTDIINGIELNIGNINGINSCMLLHVNSFQNNETTNLIGTSIELTEGTNTIDFYPIKGNKLTIGLLQNKSYIYDNNSTSIKRKVIELKSVKLLKNKFSNSLNYSEKEIELVSNLFYCKPKYTVFNDNPLLYTMTGSYSLDNNIYLSLDKEASSLNIKNLSYLFDIKRNDETFSNLSSIYSLYNQYELFTELKDISNSSTPIEFSLFKKPINSNILLYKPANVIVGGLRKQLTIGKGDGFSKRLFLSKEISINDARNAYLKVNNESWTFVDSLTDSTSTDKVWTLDKTDYKHIVFGDNTNGLSPADGAIISFSLESKLLSFEKTNNSYISKIYDEFDLDKDTIELLSIKESKANGKYILQKNFDNWKLPYRNIERDTISFTEKTISGATYSTRVFQTEETFVNGSDELTSAGDYSIDYSNGYIYSFTKIQSDNNVTCNFYFYPEKYFSKDDFDILFEGDSPVGISFKLDKLTTNIVKDYIGIGSLVKELTISGLGNTTLSISEEGDTTLNLSRRGIIRNTVNAINLFSDDVVVPQEIPFIDGHSEFYGLINVVKESIPSFTGSGLKTFTLTGGSNFYSPLGISFSDLDVFSSEKTSSGAVTVAGDYFISTSGVVTFYTSGDVSDVTCSYYYKSNSFDATNKFSIDYENGILYTITSFKINGYIEYEITNTYMNYQKVTYENIGKFNSKTNTLEFTFNKILNKDTLYKITYPVATLDIDISDFKDYYSPIVKSISFGFN